MKSSVRLALAAYVGFFIYSSLLFLFGGSGVFELRELEAHRRSLAENIVELEEIGKKLERRGDLLLHDTEEIRLNARRLGYFAEDEVPVLISGIDETGRNYTLGRMLGRFKAGASSAPLFRAIGLTSGLSVVVVLYVLTGRQRGRSTRG